MAEPIKLAIMNALRGVYDPCSIGCNVPMDVVEMGLVKDIAIDSDGTCRVNLVLTSITCFQVPVIEQAIENAVIAAGLATRVEVAVIHDELWSPAMMADHARLRIDGIRRASQAITGTRRRQWKENAVEASASGEADRPGVMLFPPTRKAYAGRSLK